MRSRFLLAAATAAVTLLPLIPARDAAAQLPVSIRASALYARQAATLSATAGGVDLGETETAANALGAEIRVGLPVIGIDLGAHYLRHFGDTDPEFEESIDGLASVGVGANEFALFAEKRFALIPMSPVKPFLGVGASYARIELSSSVDLSAGVSGTDDISSSANSFRLYGVGGIDLIGGLGLVARAGYTFSGTYELEGDVPIEFGGESVAAEVDYDGYFVSVGLSLFGI